MGSKIKDFGDFDPIGMSEEDFNINVFLTIISKETRKEAVRIFKLNYINKTDWKKKMEKKDELIEDLKDQLIELGERD